MNQRRNQGREESGGTGTQQRSGSFARGGRQQGQEQERGGGRQRQDQDSERGGRQEQGESMSAGRGGTSGESRGGASGGDAIDNLTFDWLTVMQNKCEAARAYGKYIQDARQANSQECVELFERLRDQDHRDVREIKEHLSKSLRGEMAGGGQGSSGSRSR